MSFSAVLAHCVSPLFQPPVPGFPSSELSIYNVSIVFFYMLFTMFHVSLIVRWFLCFSWFSVFFSIVVTRVSSFSLMFIYVCLSFIIFIGFSIAVECCICVPSFSIHCSMVLACFLFIFVPSFCIHFSMVMVLKSFSSFCSRSSMVLICFPIFFIDFQ